MKRLAFNSQFMNKTGNDLIPGKIHTIRQNYEYWKKFEGREVELFTWKGKAYQKGSKQKVFCVKRIVSVQSTFFRRSNFDYLQNRFYSGGIGINSYGMANNDGFEDVCEFLKWFNEYDSSGMAILHFTDFRY